jgi:hypothetical protein
MWCFCFTFANRIVQNSILLCIQTDLKNRKKCKLKAWLWPDSLVLACFPFSLAATKLAWPAPFLFLRTAQLPAHLSPAVTLSMPPRIGLSSSSSPDRAMPVMSIHTSATEPDPVAAYARDVWALGSFVSHQTSQHEVGYLLRSEKKEIFKSIDS